MRVRGSGLGGKNSKSYRTQLILPHYFARSKSPRLTSSVNRTKMFHVKHFGTIDRTTTFLEFSVENRMEESFAHRLRSMAREQSDASKHLTLTASFRGSDLSLQS
jgi:hypothetical protein